MSSVVSAIFGGSSGGSVPAPLQQSQTDPFGSIGGRTQAATELQSYMNNPSLALSSPGYQQTLNQGMQQSNAAAAASGTLQSGGQNAALQAQGQNTFGAYYQNAISNLNTWSGANQSPAQAGAVQYGTEQQSANTANALNQQSAQNLLGMGGLLLGASSSGIFGGGGNDALLGGSLQDYTGSSAIQFASQAALPDMLLGV